MGVILTLCSGPAAGRELALRPGQLAQVGRSDWVDLSNPHDPTLDDIHFLVNCGADTYCLHDLSRQRSTLVNDLPARGGADLRDGDRIVAGASVFTVRIGAATATVPGATPTAVGVAPAAIPPSLLRSAEAPPTMTVAGRALLSILREEAQPLYALLDAARDPRVVELLRDRRDESRSLYEGEQGEALADFAPYLARLDPSSALLEDLVRQGWGRSWGVYLTCEGSLAEVRKHFRHFLLVRLEDGRQVYFRFYDPRVLRDFLPTCAPEQVAEFFGPVRSFLLEAESPETMLLFTRGHRGLEQRAEPLASVGQEHALTSGAPEQGAVVRG